MADSLRQLYYGRDITADIVQQIYYSRRITADTLWPIYRVQQKQLYFNKCTAPEALDCCVRTCQLRPIAQRTALDRCMYKKESKRK